MQFQQKFFYTIYIYNIKNLQNSLRKQAKKKKQNKKTQFEKWIKALNRYFTKKGILIINEACLM